MKNLYNIIKESYDVFAGHRPQEVIDACTLCCMTEEDAKTLVSVPLGDISRFLLQQYNDAAMPEKLNVSELKYFAPRYLELIREYQFPSFEPALSLTRFAGIKKSEWTAKERQLLSDFSIAFFHQFIHSKNPTNEATALNMLLMFHKGNFDIRPLLEIWDKAPIRVAQVHYDALWIWIKVNKNGFPEVIDAFADDSFKKMIGNWLKTKIKS